MPTSPELALLTGETAGELLSAVLAAAGGELLDWRTTQVDHQPGRRTTVGYSARVRWSAGATTEEILGAATGPLPEGVARLSDGETEVGLWRFPHDPELPGLALAVDPERARKLLERTGLDVGAGEVTVRTRAYRPRRRAVIEVRIPGRRRVFVKVVRLEQARALHERHRMAAEAAVPDSLGWTDDGLVLLAGLPGRTLREVLLGEELPGEEAVTVAPESVTAALDSLPRSLAEQPRRRTWGQKARHYAEVIASAAPELGPRARELAAAVDHDQPEGPDVPVHGDLYESQLMMHEGRVSGLLDIDTAGCGERLDDAACLLAHLAVLAQIRPARAEQIDAVRESMDAHFRLALDPSALYRRTAAVVLSLATGPYRVQERNWLHNTGSRIELAERWLAASRVPDEKSLIRNGS